jgi:hypothetical protein
MTPHSVSVIIVSYNVKQYVNHCIETVLRSDFIGEIEIIVIDNNSFDETSQLIQQNFSEIKLIENHKNIGFGKAVNHASEIAIGEYLFILNPDTIIQENTISTFVNYLSTHSEVGMIGPKIINPDGTLQPTCKRSFPTLSVALPKLLGLSNIFPKTKWAGKYNLTYLDPNKTHSVDAISGSCMFIRKTLFHKIGGFDEQFFLFGEDLDLCYRLKQKEHEIHYVPSTQILHYKGESVKFAPYDSINAFYKAMILFYKKHFSKNQNILFRFGIQLGIQFHKIISFITEWRSQILSIFIDSCVVFIAFLVAFFLRFSNLEPLYISHGIIPTVYIFFWLVVGTFFQLYGRYILSYSRAVLSVLTGFFVVVAFTYFFKQFAFSRLVLITATGIVTLLIPGWRLITHFIMSRGYLYQIKDKHNILFTKKTLIIGANKDGIQIVKKIYGRVNFGLNIIGFVDSKMGKIQEKLPVPFLGTINNIRGIIKTHKIREIIFSNNTLKYNKIVSLMDNTKDLHLTYRMIPGQQDIIIGKGSIEEIGELSFINFDYSLYHRINKVAKRSFDIVFSFFLLLLLSPVILIKLLKYPIGKMIFWGENSKIITTFIFHSKNQFIKKLPLFWSILKGDLSFVGSSMIKLTAKDPKLICTPGLSSLDKIKNSHMNHSYKNQFDRYYVQNQSLGLDIEILLKTILIYFKRPENPYVPGSSLGTGT